MDVAAKKTAPKGIPTKDDLTIIKEIWLKGNQTEGYKLMQEIYADFPSSVQPDMDVEYFCDVKITKAGIEINLQKARSALGELEKASPYLGLIRTKQLKTRYHNNMAVCHRYLGNFWEMLNHIEIAHDLVEEIRDPGELHQVLMLNLAEAHTVLGNYDNSRAIYKECLRFYKKEEYTWRIGTVFQQMGNLAMHEGNTGLAKSQLLIALDEFMKLGDNIDISETYAFLARNANESGDYKDARRYAQHGIELIGADSDSPILSSCLNEYGRSFSEDSSREIQQYAIPALNDSLKLSQKHGHNYNCVFIYRALAETWEKAANFERAYFYQKAYGDLDRALRNGRTFAKIKHTQKAFEKRTNDLEIENERLKNIQLQKINNRLQNTLEDNELFMRVLSHDLKNPLGSIFSVASMIDQSELSDDLSREINWIFRESKRLHGFIQELTRICRFENSWKPEEKSFDLNQSLAGVLAEIGQIAAEKSIYIDYRYNPLERIEICNDSKGISEIIRNIFLCAVNYTAENQTITCRVEKDNTQQIILINVPEDDTPDIITAFEKDDQSNDKYLQTGSILYRLGINLSRRIAERLNCNLQYSKKGTEGIFTLNLNA